MSIRNMLKYFHISNAHYKFLPLLFHSGPLFTFSSLREEHNLQTTMDQLPCSELADVHLFYGMAKAARGLRKRQESSNGFGNPSTSASTHASELRGGHLSNYCNSVT